MSLFLEQKHFWNQFGFKQVLLKIYHEKIVTTTIKLKTWTELILFWWLWTKKLIYKKSF